MYLDKPPWLVHQGDQEGAGMCCLCWSRWKERGERRTHARLARAAFFARDRACVAAAAAAGVAQLGGAASLFEIPTCIGLWGAKRGRSPAAVYTLLRHPQARGALNTSNLMAASRSARQQTIPTTTPPLDSPSSQTLAPLHSTHTKQPKTIDRASLLDRHRRRRRAPRDEQHRRGARVGARADPRRGGRA